MGKGDARRPTQVDEETFQQRWDKAFKKRLDTPMEELTADEIVNPVPKEIVDELTTKLRYDEDGLIDPLDEVIRDEAREAGSEQGREVE